jgi:hypothetical protein
LLLPRISTRQYSRQTTSTTPLANAYQARAIREVPPLGSDAPLDAAEGGPESAADSIVTMTLLCHVENG